MLNITMQSKFYAETVKEKQSFIAERIQTLYNDENSLLANEANAVIQTEDGYIWFGGYNGLLKYDGKKFIKIDKQSHPNFTANSIRNLYESKAHTLYIASNDEGLFSYKEGIFTPIKDPTQKLSNSVRSIFEDSKGDIYITTTNGLAKVTNGELEVVECEGFSSEFLISGAMDQSNNMWLVADGGNVFVLKDSKLVKSYSVEALRKQSASFVFVDSQNRVLIGTTNDSLLVLEGGNLQNDFTLYPLNGVVKTTSIFEDHARKIWIGGEGGFGYLENDFKFINVKGTYLEGFIESIYQDYEGNYWIASSKQGILKMTRSKFLNLFLENNIDPTSINTTLLWENNLYVGTDKGLTIIGSSGKLQNELTNYLRDVRIRSLNKDKQGNLWASTYSALGVVKYDKNHSIKNWNEDNGLNKNKVRTVWEAKNGNIYVATTEGISVIKNNQIIKSYTSKDGLSNPYILSLCEDEEGAIYAGSDGGGIFKIDGDKVENYSEKEGLSSGIVLRMAYDASNKLFFISSGGRLNIWKKGEPIQSYENLQIKGNIFDIKISGDKLILITSNGLYLSTVSQFLAEDSPTFEVYDKYDGLNSFPIANSWNELTPEGELYICGGEGVYRINILNIFKNSMAPKCKINFISVDGVLFENISEIQIDKAASRITLDVSVLSFSDSKNNAVKYQLIGFDEAPIVQKIENLNDITYTNLEGGAYRFQLSGFNSDGIMNGQENTLRIDKNLGIFEYQLTYVIIVLLLIILTYLISSYFFKAKEEKLLSKQKEYKAITNQAIEAISRTVDAKDHYTSGHSQRVANYSVIIGTALRLSEEDLEALYYSALLHDIGKIGVPDDVLNKSTHLSQNEFELIKHHVTKGNEILKDFDSIQGLSEGALYHHEKFDGSGYIFGLNGQTIPFNARIIAVADAYDAMGTKRPYRDALPHETILSEFTKYSGVQFDPVIVQVMCKLIDSNAIHALNEDGSDDVVESVN